LVSGTDLVEESHNKKSQVKGKVVFVWGCPHHPINITECRTDWGVVWTVPKVEPGKRESQLPSPT
jgi:hypothetical protein